MIMLKDSINLDELQKEAEKLLALLKDRQPGLICWNDFLYERLNRIIEIITTQN